MIAELCNETGALDEVGIKEQMASRPKFAHAVKDLIAQGAEHGERMARDLMARAAAR